MSTLTASRSEAQKRKKKHLTICTNPLEYEIEHGDAGFDSVRLLHQALPEVDADNIDTRLSFLGHEIAAPIFISCMTGGSEEGFLANRNLAIAAERLRIPVGMGSIRILAEQPQLFDHFHLKRHAPSVPVLANFGGGQLLGPIRDRFLELVDRLEADAIVIHLNPGQELFQKGGDRDFRGITDAIAYVCELSRLPVIVKETGFGMAPSLISELVSNGVEYVDVAGAGGTNWVTVESYREEEEEAVAHEFRYWGIPTALILAVVRRLYGRRFEGNLIASGGLRRGLDFAMALGATVAGAALPFIRVVVEHGSDGVVELTNRFLESFRRAMVLTGSERLDELRGAPLWFDSSLAAEIESFVTTAAG